MKRSPHFRLIDKHSKECNWFKEILRKERKQTEHDTGIELNTISADTDIFLQERPKNHYEQVETDKGGNDVDHKQIKKARNYQYLSTQKRSSIYYTVRSFANKYENYSNLGLLENRFINIKGFSISYKNMFVEINGQYLAELNKYSRIYHGEVIIRDYKEGQGYIIKFLKGFRHNRIILKPSMFISRKLIENQFVKKYWAKKLEDL